MLGATTSTFRSAAIAPAWCACVSWVFFRAADFPTAARSVLAMTGTLPTGDAILPTREILHVGLVTLGLLTAHGLLRNTSIETGAAKIPRSLLVGVWTVMIGGIILNQGNGNAFIYFRF